MLHEQPITSEVGASLDIQPYRLARAAGNAATAYLLIRRSREVEHYTAQALAVFDEADLPGPRALTRLDHATALLMGEHADPAHAAAVAHRAVLDASDEGFESVKQRSEEFVSVARKWAAEPAVREVAEIVRAQRAQRALPAGE